MSAPTDRRSLSTVLLAVPVAALLVLIGGAVCIALAFGGTSGCAGASGAVGNVKGVPAKLIPIYEQAAARYRLGPKGPAVLAAINKVETDFGTNMGPSSAGAIGWMQFMPSTWATYGVDANHDGRRDPSDPWDAIFAAANYLRASGAPGDWHAAILSYNHAEWYVAEVLAAAEKYGGGNSVLASTELASCEVAAPNVRVAKMIAEANRLSALRPETEYVWGGSHGVSPTPRNGPFDCSSAVSHLLQVGGFHNPTMDTVALSSWGEPGPGRWVTILVKPYEPEAHTVIEFMPGVTPPDKRYWGTSGFIEPGHGPGWIPESTFAAGYLSRFEARHPPGF
jgi:Transglycosylase SLT domain